MIACVCCGVFEIAIGATVVSLVGICTLVRKCLGIKTKNIGK